MNEPYIDEIVENPAHKETKPMFHVRCTDKNGKHFIATLPAGFSTLDTRIEAFEKGIKVTAPNEAPIYINGSTRQISRNPEVCRTDAIIDPRFVTIGRAEDQSGIIDTASKIYGSTPIRSH
jgi:hypothetical protein